VSTDADIVLSYDRGVLPLTGADVSHADGADQMPGSVSQAERALGNYTGLLGLPFASPEFPTRDGELFHA
jgi:hypothetical protein